MAVNPIERAPAVIAERRTAVNALVNDIATTAMRGAGNYYTAETPVKTGAARSNWVMTAGEPFETVIPPYAPYDDIGHGPAPIERKEETANRDAARLQHTAALASFDYQRTPTLFLRNNVAYAELLNTGWSRQTVRGFFERGVVAALHAITGRWVLRY